MHYALASGIWRRAPALGSALIGRAAGSRSAASWRPGQLLCLQHWLSMSANPASLATCRAGRLANNKTIRLSAGQVACWASPKSPESRLANCDLRAASCELQVTNGHSRLIYCPFLGTVGSDCRPKPSCSFGASCLRVCCLSFRGQKKIQIQFKAMHCSATASFRSDLFLARAGSLDRSRLDAGS